MSGPGRDTLPPLPAASSPPRTTCVACRKSKVKCDMGTPCGRCARLDIVCEPTPPSRRGRPGQPGVRRAKRRKVDADASSEENAKAAISAERIIETSVLTRLPLAEGSKIRKNHLGVLLVAREWLAIGIRRQSCDLISRAFGLASKAQIPLGTLVDAQGDGRVCGGSLAAMAPLLFSPKSTHPCNVGKPVLATEYAPAHCAAVHRTHATLNDGWVFGRFSDLGVIRNFASPAFERDFATIECMDETFRANNQHVLRRVLPPQGCVAMSHAVGSQFRLIEKASDNPPPASFRTTVRTQDGKTIDVDALFAMRVAEPATTRILCTLTPVGPTMDPGAVTSGTASITPAASTTVPNIDIDIPELDLGSPPGLPQYPPTIDSKDTWNFDLSAELGFDTAFLLGLGLEEWGDPKDS